MEKLEVVLNKFCIVRQTWNYGNQAKNVKVWIWTLLIHLMCWLICLQAPDSQTLWVVISAGVLVIQLPLSIFVPLSNPSFFILISIPNSIHSWPNWTLLSAPWLIIGFLYGKRRCVLYLPRKYIFTHFNWHLNRDRMKLKVNWGQMNTCSR